MTSQTLADLGRPTASVSPGALILFIALAGILGFAWPGLELLARTWETPEYSHGYLIPPIALYLFLYQMSREPPAVVAATPRRGLGILVIGLAFLVGLTGNLADAPSLSAYGLVLAIAGLVLIVLGTRRGLRYWPAVVYLGFMLPLPFAIYLPISSALQTISSEVGVEIISALGVSVFLDGNVIDLGTYKLQVAEACSGLRYLFPLMSFSFLFAVLYRGPALHKLILFLSAIPIAIAMNSVRIGIIGFLVDRYGIEQAEGFLHFFEGWIIFIACIVLLYLFAVLLQRTLRDRQPIHSMITFDLGALGHEAAKARTIDASPALIATAILYAVAAITWAVAPPLSGSEPARQPFVLFPLALDDRHGTVRTLEPVIEQVLAAEDYLAVDFSGRGGAPSVDLFVAYYKSRHQGVGIHDPRICIPGAGWEVVSWEEVPSGATTASGAPFDVNRAVIRKGTSRQLVYYWFQQGGRSIASAFDWKLYSLFDSVTRGRTDSALVRLITPVAPTESIETADARLRQFLGALMPLVPTYLPD